MGIGTKTRSDLVAGKPVAFQVKACNIKKIDPGSHGPTSAEKMKDNGQPRLVSQTEIQVYLGNTFMRRPHAPSRKGNGTAAKSLVDPARGS